MFVLVPVQCSVCICERQVDGVWEKTKNSALVFQGCFCGGLPCGTVNGDIYNFNGCVCSFYAGIIYSIFLLCVEIFFSTM